MLLLAHINGFMVSDASITYDGDGTFNICHMYLVNLFDAHPRWYGFLGPT